MGADPKDNDKRNPKRYLRNIDDTYIFDADTGIYKPRAEETEQERKRQHPGSNPESRFFTNPRTDWRPVLVATCVSLLTIVLLFFTVRYSRLQYREMRRSAEAAANTLCEIQ